METLDAPAQLKEDETKISPTQVMPGPKQIKINAALSNPHTNEEIHRHGSVRSGQPSTSNPEAPHTKVHRVLVALKWLLLDQWFLVVFGFLILIASQVQVPEAQQHIKRLVITYLSVAIIFFINGCTLPTQVLVQNYFRWRIHLFVQVQCFLVTSAATFAIVSLCATNPHFMDPWLLIGLLFLGVVPTTMSSNVIMTRQAHGNTALTVVQSTLGQFLCPFLTPILLKMYLSTGAWYTKVLVNSDNYNEIYRRVFKQLGLSVFVPLLVGQAVRNVFPKATETVFTKWKMVKLSPIALLVLIWSTFDQAFGTGAFAEIKTSNTVFLVFMNIALYFTWLAICFGLAVIWLPKKDVIACCYCCPAKALTMLVPLSAVMYVSIDVNDQSKLQIPVILFQAFQVAIGGFLTIPFRRWIRPEEEEERREKELERNQGQED